MYKVEISLYSWFTEAILVILYHVDSCVSIKSIKDESYTYYNIYLLSNGLILLLESNS